MNGFCYTCQKVQLLNVETSVCLVCGMRWRPSAIKVEQPEKRRDILSAMDKKFLRAGGIKPEF